MEETIQVRMSYLNKLLDQTGEVIITGTRLSILEKEMEEIFLKQRTIDKNLLNLVKQISMSSRQTANGLHKNVMDIRQVDLKETMVTLQRLVRDLAKNQGKTVKFTMSGAETLVDKTIIEELSGALIHIIRNSVDHGVESAGDRAERNKPAEGHVSLTAYKKERFIIFEIEDDGRGIDVDRVAEKALAKGLTTEESLAKMSMAEKYEFIFLPGFSTRDVVSEVSGRGVGMDVVKTSVEKLNGSVMVDSKKGTGTRFTLKIPVISAVNITDALMIEAGESIYAIPISTVVATLSASNTDVKTVSGISTILFRGKTLTVYNLQSLLNRESFGADSGSVKNIVVVRERDDMIGMSVDRFLPPQKIVIKLLDECFGKVRGISGTTLLSGDSVGLIIDVPEVINLAMGRESSSKSAVHGLAGGQGEGALGAAAADSGTRSAARHEKAKKKLRVEIDSDVDPSIRMEIALSYEGKLLDAFTSNKPVYEVDLMLEKDIIKAEKSRFDIYKIAKSCGDLLSVVPMTAHIPDNIKEFSPEGFDMRIKFFIISLLKSEELAKKLSIDAKQIRVVGVTVKEEAEAKPSDQVFQEVELLTDYEAFALDTQKNLMTMSQCILGLEENPSNSEAIKEIFRAVHTLKSATAMLGIKNMADIAHELETILDRVRSGLEVIDEEKIELLFDVLKFFEECMKSIRVGIKPVLSNASLHERIMKYREESPEKKLIRVVDVKTEKFTFTSYENLVLQEKISQKLNIQSILVEFAPDLPMKMVNAFMLFRELKNYGDILKTIPTMEEIDKGNFELYFKILFVTSHEQTKYESVFKTEEIITFDISKFDER